MTTTITGRGEKAAVDYNETNSKKSGGLYALDYDIRWLVALISDAGIRLAEAAGLLHDDFDLTGMLPVVNVHPNVWRALKTDSSTRSLPLVGQSLWAAQRIFSSAKQG